jgi:hypothetical protein
MFRGISKTLRDFAVLKKVRANKILLLTRLRTTVDETGTFDFLLIFIIDFGRT